MTTQRAAQPTIRWLWNGDLDASVLASQLDSIRALGHRAVAIAPWAGLGQPYLDDAYGQRLAAACAEAERFGMTLWLGDDLSWPSGTAAGLLLRDRPQLAQRALVCTSRWVRQESPQPVPWRGEGERLVLAIAAGVGGARRDLSRMLEQRGHPITERRGSSCGGHRRAWDAELWQSDLLLPPGDWFVTIAAQIRTHPLLPAALGTTWSGDTPGALDVLNPSAVRAFIDHVYEHFYALLRPWAGGTFAGFITTAPPQLDAHPVTAPEGWRTDLLPWTQGLEHAWAPGGAMGFARDLPALLAQLHDQLSEDEPDPLSPLTDLAAARHRAAYWDQLSDWCAERGLGSVSSGPNDLPAAPYTLRADRKRAAPSRLVGLRPAVVVGEDAPAAAPIPVHGWPLATPWSGAERRDLLDVLQPLWQWEPASRNVHPLDGWQRVPGARGERLRLRATFGADFAPPDLCLVFESGTVEEIVLNGTSLNLGVARPPDPQEVEFADVCARLLPLAHHPAVRTGENGVEATVFIPAAERIAFAPLVLAAADGSGPAELLGPIFLAGTFALRPDATGHSMIRPPLEMGYGPWGAAGYPRFAGTATYRQTVVLAAPPSAARHLVVDALGGLVSAAVDNTSLGSAVRSPCIFDATAALRAGINHIAVTVTSDLSPRIHGSAAGLAAARLERSTAI